MTTLSPDNLWDLFKHVKSWLINLERASEKRKKESIEALRAVLSAVRETESYMRRLKTKGRDHAIEDRLSALWTELSYKLSDIGLEKLAKKCYMKGKYWANREKYSDDYFDKYGISLELIEHIVKKHLKNID